MPTIKLSKTQWELIGKKTGWMKKANAVTAESILNELKFKKTMVYSVLSKIPSFRNSLQQAADIVNGKEKIDQSALSQAQDLKNKIDSAVSKNPNLASNMSLKKEAGIFGEIFSGIVEFCVNHPKVLALLIVVYLGFKIAGAVVPAFENVREQEQKHYDEVQKELLK